MVDTITTLTEEQAAYLATVPPMHRPGYVKALTTRSLAAAVRAKCRDCVGFEDAARRVRECTITTCPLWPVRR